MGAFSGEDERAVVKLQQHTNTSALTGDIPPNLYLKNRPHRHLFFTQTL
jgi:hypothetical protein